MLILMRHSPPFPRLNAGTPMMVIQGFITTLPGTWWMSNYRSKNQSIPFWVTSLKLSILLGNVFTAPNGLL
jgi:hypothetical protein